VLYFKGTFQPKGALLQRNLPTEGCFTSKEVKLDWGETSISKEVKLNKSKALTFKKVGFFHDPYFQESRVLPLYNKGYRLK
jgi:hypothetical protein